MVVVGFTIITMVICTAIVICKYIDKAAINDMSYKRYHHVMTGISEIKEILNNKE